MRAAPRISVLLPVWNAATTLPACLASLRRQTETSWECALVDDGSTDASLALARACAAHDARFEVIARPHLGLVAATSRPASNAPIQREGSAKRRKWGWRSAGT